MEPGAVVLLLLPLCCGAASVLGFFPFPGSSHHNLFGPLMERLADRGHRVLYVTPIRWKSSHDRLHHLMVKNYGKEILGTLDFIKLGEMSISMHSQTVYDLVHELLMRVLQEDQIQKLIHSNDTFDAVILESYFFQEANSALIHKFGAVGIEFVPLADAAWVNELSGLPNSYSYMMDYKTTLSDRLRLPDKLYNLYAGYAATITSYLNTWRMQKLMDKYYNYTGWEDRPRLTQLLSNRSIILVNKDPLLAYPFPTAPHVKEVAGISVLPASTLREPLKTFMDEGKEGVIYMSLGMNLMVSEVFKETLKAFLNVFQTLNQRVLMKWESSYNGTLPDNVMIMKKFPQQDILAHENCVLFITHGGYMSLAETVHYGVPVIGIPFYGDQPKNVIWAQEVGIGIHLSTNNLSETSINWAVKEMLQNSRYRERMCQRSKIFNDRRHSPLEEAVYWVEHAIKYPNVLTPASAYMSFVELHMLDMLCAVMFVGAAAIVGFGCVYRAATWLLYQRKETTKLKVN